MPVRKRPRLYGINSTAAEFDTEFGSNPENRELKDKSRKK
jgi:hypothetical protein